MKKRNFKSKLNIHYLRAVEDIRIIAVEEKEIHGQRVEVKILESAICENPILIQGKLNQGVDWSEATSLTTGMG